MSYRLPITVERSVREAESNRRLLADEFESKTRAMLVDVNQGITCQKRCNHCCRYPVLVSLLEGVTLFRWLAEHGLWLRTLKERLEKHHRATWGLSPSVWMLSQIPCPLLDQDLCTAYEIRPFVCRTLLSTLDSHYCHPHRFIEGKAGIIDRRGIESRFQEMENRLLKASKMVLLRAPVSTAILCGEKLCKEGLAVEDVSEGLFEDWARNC